MCLVVALDMLVVVVVSLGVLVVVVVALGVLVVALGGQMNAMVVQGLDGTGHDTIGRMMQ